MVADGGIPNYHRDEVDLVAEVFPAKLKALSECTADHWDIIRSAIENASREH